MPPRKRRTVIHAPKGGSVKVKGKKKVAVPPGAKVTITHPKKAKKGGKKVPRPRPKKPVRRGAKKPKKPARRKKPKPAGRGGKKPPVWRSHGVASGANVGGERFQARIKRPEIDFVRETGFKVRSKKVGPKKRVINI